MWPPCPQERTALTLTRFKKAQCQRTFPKRVSPSKPAQPGHPWGGLGGWLSQTSGQWLHLCSGSCKTSREVTCWCPVRAVMAVPASSWTTPLQPGPTPSSLHSPNPHDHPSPLAGLKLCGTAITVGTWMSPSTSSSMSAQNK